MAQKRSSTLSSPSGLHPIDLPAVAYREEFVRTPSLAKAARQFSQLLGDKLP